MDLVDNEGENLELYALLIASIIASAWAFFVTPTIAVLLATTSLGIAEALRNRHARRQQEEAFLSMRDAFVDLGERVHRLEQMTSDPELIVFRDRLKREEGAPTRPRISD